MRNESNTSAIRTSNWTSATGTRPGDRVYSTAVPDLLLGIVFYRGVYEDSDVGATRCVSSQTCHGTTPCSGRGSWASMAMYSSR